MGAADGVFGYEFGPPPVPLPSDRPGDGCGRRPLIWGAGPPAGSSAGFAFCDRFMHENRVAHMPRTALRRLFLMQMHEARPTYVNPPGGNARERASNRKSQTGISRSRASKFCSATQKRAIFGRAPRGRARAAHAPLSTSPWAGEVAGRVGGQFNVGATRQGFLFFGAREDARLHASTPPLLRKSKINLFGCGGVEAWRRTARCGAIRAKIVACAHRRTPPAR